MPSRKRNKGKARKAKADEAKASAASNNDGPRNGQRDHGHRQQEQARICGMMRNMSLGAERACDHGCPHPPKDDICTKFVVSFNKSVARSSSMPVESGENDFVATAHTIWNATNEGLLSAGPSNQHSWEEPATLRKLVSYLESLGTDILLQYPGESAFPIAYAILIVESMGNTKQSDMVKTLYGPGRDLYEDMARETTRFFAKRIKCHCLKEKYSQLRRKKPSSGQCQYCGKIKDRKELKICTCCNYSQYCSKVCQTKDWPKHRGRFQDKKNSGVKSS